MTDWNILKHSRTFADDQGFTASPYGIALPTAAAHTKGAYVTVAAALTHSCTGVLINLEHAINSHFILDIAIGAAGSEVVVIPDLFISRSTNVTNTSETAFFPLAIRAGTRVAARVQNGIGGSPTQAIKMHFLTEGFAGLLPVQQWKAWGVVTASTSLTSVASAVGAHTKGSWVQLIAATELTTKWLRVAFQFGTAASYYATDIGVGAAGSEVPILDNLVWTDESNAESFLLPMAIPAGSRLAARTANQGGNRTLKVGLMGGG